MRPREHWEAVYGRKQPEQVSWYRPHLDQSLRFIAAAGLPPTPRSSMSAAARRRWSTDLLDRGHSNITVLDVSPKAIESAKARLGARAARVHWLVADITTVDLAPGAYDFWHDRAVFHFLRDDSERRSYVATVRKAVKTGGHVLVATFGPQGPSQCSGLDVVRYGADELHAAFGADFHKVDSATEVHTTPWGADQQFVYCYCRLAGPGQAGRRAP
jgi:SAM-dependent methyltransferase